MWSIKWTVLHEKVLNVLSHCHTKRRTGALGHARPSFGMTPTFQKRKKSQFFFHKNHNFTKITIFFSKKRKNKNKKEKKKTTKKSVSYQKKDGRGPILLLVWHQLWPLGTFSHSPSIKWLFTIILLSLTALLVYTNSTDKHSQRCCSGLIQIITDKLLIWNFYFVFAVS